MKKETLSITDKIFLSVILLIASLLRLWDLGSVPFMHDEFSALSRTVYDSFHDLFTEGVMKNDSHPAGVQFFLFLMVKLFGWNELCLKLPFALMGVASVYLVFKIGQQWFNNNVGLLSAAFVTVSELFVFYSQLIRPYSPGLFFILLFVYFWSKLLFTEDRISIKTCIGFALAAFMSSQIHNFSLAQAGLIYLSGFLFLKKDNKLQIKAYLLSGIGALLLFIPTSPIFYYQFFVSGGIGGWLTMPELSFLPDFLRYTLNYSQLFIFSSIILIISPFLVNKVNKDNKIALRIVGLLWFFIPLTLAFVYSKLKEPILQFSTLIFGFPFFVIILFSFYDSIKVTFVEKLVAIGVIIIVGMSSLIFDRQYYKQVYNQGLDQMAVAMKEDQLCYNDSITFISFSNRSFMPKFYQDREGVENNYFFDKISEITDYHKFLSNLDTKYIGVGLTDYSEMSWELSSLSYYPYIVKESQWFNTKYLLLSKDRIKEDAMIVMKKDVDIKRGNEWACTFTMNIDTVEDIRDIGFVADIQAVDTVKDITLVVAMRSVDNDSLLLWRGTDNEYGIMPNEKYLLTSGIHFDEAKYDKNNIELKVYLWNKGKASLKVNKILYYNSKKYPYFLGLYEPLK